MSYRVRGEPLTIDYFIERSIPEPNSGCWIWLHASNRSQGYGRVFFNSKHMTAHRAVLQVATGIAIPPNMDVCHHCDNKSCVNPDHLYVGSRSRNVLDAMERGQFKPAFRKLTVEQVRAIRADTRSNSAVALAYGMSNNTIWAIRRRLRWPKA